MDTAPHEGAVAKRVASSTLSLSWDNLTLQRGKRNRHTTTERRNNSHQISVLQGQLCVCLRVLFVEGQYDGVSDFSQSKLVDDLAEQAVIRFSGVGQQLSFAAATQFPGSGKQKHPQSNWHTSLTLQ
ncbi:hypothetical protein B566_EDAN007481 [Ephemera danica]|nr:hypothetical protein B566_EDAN007481 [Ephemera danica]